MIDMHDPIVRAARENKAVKRWLFAVIATVVAIDAALILWSRL